MAGFRSLLAQWIGGAGSDTEQAGVRNLLARWIGGAGSPSATQAGVRGLFAFWSGGATAVAPIVVDPDPDPEVDTGGGYSGASSVVASYPQPHAIRGHLRLTLHAGISAQGHVSPVAVRGTLGIAGRITFLAARTGSKSGAQR